MIEQLQASLGDAYALERELGGGGMSRVFVAYERRLERRVVVKVLLPELAASVSVERFEREIRLAASLSQANIVPVLTAGVTDGLPYYTMPLVDGESLRSRLAQPTVLSIQDVVSVLRDVARALAYAHERGVVHRDIKPDNILLSGGTAVVTDFGIAKAIWSARTEPDGAKLTQTGLAIGTPAYMSPEQVAGDPAIDHRADLYSLGCMAYELLTGQTPFPHPSVQQIVVAHLTEEPELLTIRRPDVPAVLSLLVHQCLAKSADARPNSANEVILRLEAVGTGETLTSIAGEKTWLIAQSGTPATVEAVPRTLHSQGMGLPLALACFVAAGAAVAVANTAAMRMLDVPDWAPVGSVVVMALLLAVIVSTGRVLQPGRSDAWRIARTIGLRSWHRVAFAGAAAMVALVALIAADMKIRAAGIGPAGSLIGAGRIHPADSLLVADFDVGSQDPVLSSALSEAMRTELSQSRAIAIMTTNAVVEALARMQRPASSRLDLPVARELARREGIKAVVHGRLAALGSGFLVSLSLIEPESGNDLASFQATVDGPEQLIATLDVLGRKLRAKVGESLRAVRSNPPLEQVTTSSLPALIKYAQGLHAADVTRDYPKAIGLLQEAIVLDTTFAMAYRKLASSLYNAKSPDSLIMAASVRAYALRARLPDSERLLTEATYFLTGPGQDLDRAARAYELLFALDSTNATMLNNLGTIYLTRREFARAAPLFRRVSALPGSGLVERENLFQVLLYSGDIEGADSVAQDVFKKFRSDYEIQNQMVRIALARGLSDSAQRLIDSGLRQGDAAVRQQAMTYMADLSLMHGRVSDAVGWISRIAAFDSARGAAYEPSAAEFTSAWADIRLRGLPERGRRTLDAEFARRPLLSEGFVRQFTGGMLYAMSGRASLAHQVLDEWRSSSDTSFKRTKLGLSELLLAEIALAEHRPLDALRAFQRSDSIWHLPDRLGVFSNLARAFDAARLSDSTIFYLERYLSSGSYVRVGSLAGFSGPPGWDSADPLHRALILNRLGALYEARGDRKNAIARYSEFVQLWTNADPDFQATVTLAKARIATMQVAAGR